MIIEKIKVTQKEIKNGWENVIRIGYCEAQYLLRFKTPKFYSCGAYGWKCDYYIVDNNTIISTGYAPVGNITNYELTKNYEQKARKILENNSLSYDEKEIQVNKLLNEFITKILKIK